MTTIDRRRFIERSALLALAAYAGRAGAQDAPRSSFGADATAELVTHCGVQIDGHLHHGQPHHRVELLASLRRTTEVGRQHGNSDHHE